MFDALIKFIYSLPGGTYAAFIAYCIFFGAGFYTLYKIFLDIAKKLTSFTKTKLDDYVFEAMKDPIKLALFFTTVYISVNLVWGNIFLGSIRLFDAYLLLLMVAVTFALDKVGEVLLNWYSKEIAPKTETSFDDEVLPIIKNVYKIALYISILIIILGKLGVEIAPLVTSLGIAGLAVALALQDSLGNFFAGLNISLDKPLKPGDYVEISSLGVKGVILDVGWRSTRIKTWDNNIVIIPNMTLAKAVITNYHKPSEEYVVVYKIGTSYNVDVDHVVDVLTKVINDLSEEEADINKAFVPIVRFDGFGDFSLNFKIIFKVNSFGSRYGILAKLQRKIFYAFKENNIEIPFPTQTIYLEGKEEKNKENEKEDPKKNKKSKKKKRKRN